MYKTETTITLDEIIKLNRVFLFKLQKKRLILMSLYELLLIWICVSAFFKKWYFLGIVFLICSLFVPLLWDLILKSNSKKYLKTNKIAQKMIMSFTFAEDKIELETGRGNSYITYDEVYKFVETKTNFYIFISVRQAYIIVKDNCSGELIEFIKSKFGKGK